MLKIGQRYLRDTSDYDNHWGGYVAEITGNICGNAANIKQIKIRKEKIEIFNYQSGFPIDDTINDNWKLLHNQDKISYD